MWSDPEVAAVVTPINRLLIAAGRYGTGSPDDPEVRAAAAAIPDWDRAFETAKSHRLVPFVMYALTRAGAEVPQATVSRLMHRCVEVALRSNRALEETARLQQALLGAGVRSFAYKGPALAARAYGNTSWRDSVDLDLVVEPGRIADAIAVLQREGYRLPPGMSVRRALTVHTAHGQLHMDPVDPTMPGGVDLHWRWSNPSVDWSPPIGSLFAHATVLEAGGVSLTVVDATHELLLQLLHGARHQWRSIEWLLLVKALLRRPELDPSLLLERSVLGIRGRRAVLIGCELARLVFAADLPPVIDAAIEADLSIAAMARAMAAALVSSDTMLPRDHRLLRASLDGKRDLARYWIVSGLAPTPREAEWVRLPEFAIPLYWPVRLLRLATVVLAISEPSGLEVPSLL